MSRRDRILKWLGYLIILFIAAGISGVLHELGHFFTYKALGYSPRLNIGYGSVFTYDAEGNAILETMLPPSDGIIALAGGPAVTLLLAICFTVLYLKFRHSFSLFAVAMVNSVFRFNILVDGFNSDEGMISEILLNSMGSRAGRMNVFLVPLAVWTLSIVLSSILVSRQTFFKRTYWAIPLFAVVGGVFTVLSFGLLGLVFP